MGGFFGTISHSACATDLFYGTDYNSHLGTRRGGMATYNKESGFVRSIHNLENAYFRSKFETALSDFVGNSGIGVISDTDPQPIVINSHLGKFAIVTVAKINNINELENEMLAANMHFSEMSLGKTNQTELVALLIVQGKTFVEGIENVFNRIKGSCSMRRIFPIIVLPLVLAWLIREFLPRLHTKLSSISGVSFYLWAISLTCVTAITVKSLVDSKSDTAIEWFSALVGLVICCIQFILGKTIGQHFGQRISGGQGLGQKNTSLVIWISQLYLNPISSLGPCSYVIWQNIINSWQLWKKRKSDKIDL